MADQAIMELEGEQENAFHTAPQKRTLDFQSALAASLDSRVLLKGEQI
jgi:hypothetical protein